MARYGFYTTEKLGPKQSLTPEGFLLCEEVPIARTGMMVYGPDETPIAPGPEGITKIFREAEDVFSPMTIASYAGKSVVVDHPEEDVAPHNWKELEVGVCLNPRRGEGNMDDLLLADFLVKDPDTIKMIQSAERREVSCGYDADYIETAPGVGKQTRIIGNHIALVEQGRCGSRCKIGDHQPKKGSGNMAKKKSTWDRLLSSFGVKDAEELQEKLSMDEGEAEVTSEEGEQHIHIHHGVPSEGSTMDDGEIEQFIAQNATEHDEFRSRLDAIEQALAAQSTGDEDPDEEILDELKEEAPVGTSDDELEEVVKARDSRYLADSFRDTVAMAEILAPGIRIPVFDSQARPADSFKGICKFRRSALDQAYTNPATRQSIDQVLGGKPLNTKTMDCAAVRHVFRASAAMQRNQNNTQVHDHSTTQAKTGGVRSIAELNKKNQEKWAK